MSEEGIPGAMLRTPAGTYFIPESDLQSYRLPDDLAEAVAAEMDDEVSGFAIAEKGDPKVELRPMTWSPKFLPDMKRTMLHTATRM